MNENEIKEIVKVLETAKVKTAKDLALILWEYNYHKREEMELMNDQFGEKWHDDRAKEMLAYVSGALHDKERMAG